MWGLFRNLHNTKKHNKNNDISLAEGVGFEPTVPLKGTTVFETAPFNHSGTPPLGGLAMG